MSDHDEFCSMVLAPDEVTRRWQAGEHAAALAAAIGASGVSLHAIAKRIAGIDDAADIVQEALLRVWNHPERFDATRGTLGAYLLVTTRGTALDHIRRTQRRRVREQRGGVLDLDVDLDQVPESIDADLISRLRIALNGLPDDQHELIAIAFFGGVSYRKIATRLGMPEGTVKSRMRRTLTRLREDLQPGVGEDGLARN
jgi:RNA polymerase sigma-70 factor (ECF subfamily)